MCCPCRISLVLLMDLNPEKQLGGQFAINLPLQTLVLVSDRSLMKTRSRLVLNSVGVLQASSREKLNRQRLCKLREKKDKPPVTSTTCLQQSWALKGDYRANTYIIWVVWIERLIGFLSHWPGFIRLEIKFLSQLCGGWPGVYFFSSSFQVFCIKVRFCLASVSLNFSPLVSWWNNHKRIIFSVSLFYPHIIWGFSDLKREGGRGKDETVWWQTW